MHGMACYFEIKFDVKLANELGADYDGWETSIEKK
jgi:hypothetical protein